MPSRCVRIVSVRAEAPVLAAARCRPLCRQGRRPSGRQSHYQYMRPGSARSERKQVKQWMYG